MYSEKCQMTFLDNNVLCIHWLSLVALDWKSHQLKSQMLSCLAWPNSINKLLIIWRYNNCWKCCSTQWECDRWVHEGQPQKRFFNSYFFRATRNLQFMIVSVGLESELRSAHINSSCSIQVCFYHRFSMGFCGRGCTSYDIYYYTTQGYK